LITKVVGFQTMQECTVFCIGDNKYSNCGRYGREFNTITPLVTDEDFGTASLFHDTPYKPNLDKLIFAPYSVIDVSIGPSHSLFLTQDGSVYAVGENDRNKLGIEGLWFFKTLVEPVKIRFFTRQPFKVVRVLACWCSSFFFCDDGTVWASGSFAGNDYNGIGIQKISDKYPKFIQAIQTFQFDQPVVLLTKSGDAYRYTYERKRFVKMECETKFRYMTRSYCITTSGVMVGVCLQDFSILVKAFKRHVDDNCLSTTGTFCLTGIIYVIYSCLESGRVIMVGRKPSVFPESAKLIVTYQNYTIFVTGTLYCFILEYIDSKILRLYDTGDTCEELDVPFNVSDPCIKINVAENSDQLIIYLTSTIGNYFNFVEQNLQNVFYAENLMRICGQKNRFCDVVVWSA
jgi:hypothetical protein